MALGACSGQDGSLSRLLLTPASTAVFVGERTSLTPVFDGDGASIDGIGRVQSGVAVETPPLSRATTFTLRVDRGDAQVQAQTTVQANYRNRIRLLDSAPVGQNNHVAAALPDGGAIVMGGNTSESFAVPDSTLTQIFSPATEKLARGPDLMFSVVARLFTSVAPLVIGGEVPPELVGRVGVGVSATEIFDPATGLWSAGPALNPAFYGATVTMLSNGKVLVFGGQDAAGSPQAAAALFE
jgi:hypothetical protein